MSLPVGKRPMARYVRPVPLWMRIGCSILGIAFGLLVLATVIVLFYVIAPEPPGNPGDFSFPVERFERHPTLPRD